MFPIPLDFADSHRHPRGDASSCRVCHPDPLGERYAAEFRARMYSQLAQTTRALIEDADSGDGPPRR